jgi:hypothetical protein
VFKPVGKVPLNAKEMHVMFVITIYFEITEVEKHPDTYTIYLSEHNIIPEFYKHDKLLSKGFYEPVTRQDLDRKIRVINLLFLPKGSWAGHNTEKLHLTFLAFCKTALIFYSLTLRAGF